MSDEIKGVAQISHIDTQMYLRDGAPHATVCRAVTKDGRVGIGVYRGDPLEYDKATCDLYALQDAVVNLPLRQPEPGDGAAMDAGMVEKPEVDDDLQAALGQPARN